MTTERSHTVLQLTKDARLLAGVRGAVEFIAARGGMIDGERANLGAAAEEAAREALERLDKQDPACTITIEDFDDRIEVRLEHGAKSGVTSFAGGTPEPERGSSRGADVMRRVDRVFYEAQNGKSSTTLVKYFSKKPARR